MKKIILTLLLLTYSYGDIVKAYTQLCYNIPRVIQYNKSNCSAIASELTRTLLDNNLTVKLKAYDVCYTTCMDSNFYLNIVIPTMQAKE